MTPTSPIVLDAAQARVLGALVEKEVTTPDYYPLSLNALDECVQSAVESRAGDGSDEEEVQCALQRASRSASGQAAHGEPIAA